MVHARRARRSLRASPGPPDGSRSFGARCALVLIRAYQLSLSAFLGRTCRHLPTCSDYGLEAIGRFGLWAGGWMTLARLWRCRPFGSHGFDPAPDALPAGARWYRPWRYGRWSGRHIEHTFADG